MWCKKLKSFYSFVQSLTPPKETIMNHSTPMQTRTTVTSPPQLVRTKTYTERPNPSQLGSLVQRLDMTFEQEVRMGLGVTDEEELLTVLGLTDEELLTGVGVTEEEDSFLIADQTIAQSLSGYNPVLMRTNSHSNYYTAGDDDHPHANVTVRKPRRRTTFTPDDDDVMPEK